MKVNKYKLLNFLLFLLLIAGNALLIEDIFSYYLCWVLIWAIYLMIIKVIDIRTISKKQEGKER